MPIFDEDEKGINTTEGFPDFSVTRGYVRREEKKPGFSDFIKKIPFLSIILIVLIVLIGGATAFLAQRLQVLSTEINELKGLKDELSGMQTSIGSGIDAANKDRAKLKGEVARLRNELDAMRAQQRHQAEAARERQAAREAKKKAGTKKTYQKTKKR